MERPNKTNTELVSDASTLEFIEFKPAWTAIQHADAAGGGKWPRAPREWGF